MTTPVSDARIQVAYGYGLHNVDHIAATCREAGVPFHVACALFEKESMGRNVYGHDKGGALSGFPYPVSRENYRVFIWLVRNGQTSNGVGPAQITWPGFFSLMLDDDLKPWDIHDNMRFGLDLLRSYHDFTGTWQGAGTKYNGAEAYGVDLAKKVGEWKGRLNV